jgi:hypothetical protein
VADLALRLAVAGRALPPGSDGAMPAMPDGEVAFFPFVDPETGFVTPMAWDGQDCFQVDPAGDARHPLARLEASLREARELERTVSELERRGGSMGHAGPMPDAVEATTDARSAADEFLDDVARRSFAPRG